MEKDGENLTDALPGAYSGDVIFLPRELEVSTVRVPLKGEVQGSFNLDKTSAIHLFVGLGIASVFLVASLALYNLYQKRYPTPSRSAFPADTGNTSASGLPPAKYMELPVISMRSNSTTDLSDSSSSDLSHH